MLVANSSQQKDFTRYIANLPPVNLPLVFKSIPPELHGKLAPISAARQEGKSKSKLVLPQIQVISWPQQLVEQTPLQNAYLIDIVES